MIRKVHRQLAFITQIKEDPNMYGGAIENGAIGAIG